MSVIAETWIADPVLDGPMIVHICTVGNVFTGLCGARLLGVPAVKEAPICGQCLRIEAHLLGHFTYDGHPAGAPR